MPRKSTVCPQCEATVSLSNIAKHKISKSCANGGKNRTKKEIYPWREWQQSDGTFVLPDGYTGTKIACRNYLIAAASSKQPNRRDNHGLKGWQLQIKLGTKQVHNKGKPLSAEQRKKLSVAKLRFMEANPDYMSAERRKAFSDTRKRVLQERPELHSNRILAGNRHMMTYPEKVAFDWFARHGIPAEHNKPIGRFYPDFTLGQVIVEIDGERWHSKPEHVARDQARDAKLTAMGYTIYRIPSKDRIEDALAKIFLSDTAQVPDSL